LQKGGSLEQEVIRRERVSQTMKMSKAIMSEGRERGLDHFFGIPGGGTQLDLIEVGRQLGIQFVNMNHESSAAISAAYYGRVQGTAGLVMSIRGVGAGNLVGGVTNAHFERLPVVALCETAASSTVHGESVQQCDQAKLFEGVSKYQNTLEPETACQAIKEAFFHATEGRPGAAVLHLPAGLGEVRTDGAQPAVRSDSDTLPTEGVARLQKILRDSRRPVILAGADVIRAKAREQLLQLAEALGAAVLVTMDARGVFPESNPRWAGVYLGMANPNVVEARVLDQADLVLVVGVDAMMTHVPWKSRVPTCEIVARAEYSTLTSPTLRLDGNLATLLTRLAGDPRPGFSPSEVQAIRAEILRNFTRPSRARFAAQDVIEIARGLLPQDGILVSETGAFVCMLEHLWPVDDPGTYFGTSGGRSMGLMVPGILGAKLADPDRPMVGLGADGSLLMRLGELEVFSRMRVAVPLIIINDQALGTMKWRQRALGLPDYGLEFHAVDFGAIAEACGLRGVTVDTPEGFRRELSEAMRVDRTTLIDARVDPEAYVASFGPTIGVISSPRP
jgi:acetolactate synthase I/II/III large subunit